MKPAALPNEGAEVAILPCPREKKPRGILWLSVPRDQKLRHQPRAGPKSRKDRRPLGKHSIIQSWPLAMEGEETISSILEDSFGPSSPRASASPIECPLCPPKPQSLSKSPISAEKPQAFCLLTPSPRGPCDGGGDAALEDQSLGGQTKG
ncbi:hypothetical protein PoB_007600500 [Plakobranchus ocellatus]|uniref:Uncharacterized protein n=1 Tax=Plakobranchus ocellatus TaxID=259542 RepID=A0AAV4DZL1_9GAST|nr:hypothetical protein PoB_007600500 [Plakobranchus ocellatus]